MASVDPILEIDGAVLVSLSANIDERGSFLETYRQEWFEGKPPMLQSNRSDKVANCIVGLHFHLKQADYWYVVNGIARVVLYDLRVGSPTQGSKWIKDISSDDALGVYVPPGVGHGFASLTNLTLYYQVDRYYDPNDELGVIWNDPHLDIDWGVDNPIISERDQRCKKYLELSNSERPRFSL